MEREGGREVERGRERERNNAYNTLIILYNNIIIIIFRAFNCSVS